MSVVRRTIVLAVVGIVAAGGCGQDQDSPSSGNGKRQATPTPTAACERASRELLDAIATGLDVGGGESRLRNGYAVRSGVFEKVYMVAADIQGSGMEGPDDIGVWATNSPEAEGVIYAVDAVAQEFSDWGDADKTQAGITASSDGVDEARSCAEK
jgi:hypothetical protein